MQDTLPGGRIQIEMTEEDLAYIKPNCVSCGISIDSKSFKDNGNYCIACCGLASRMLEIRELKDYVFKKCRQKECEEGKIFTKQIKANGQESKKYRKCKKCVFKNYSNAQKTRKFKDLFKRWHRLDLLRRVDWIADEKILYFFI
jgi:hypothetical protein